MNPNGAMSQSPPRSRRANRLERLRLVAVPCAVVVAIGLFAASVHSHYPVQKWLFWVYASCWLSSLYFAAACLSGGHFVLRTVFRDQMRLDAHLVFSFATGILTFFLGMFVGGLLGLYGAAFSLAWPTLMVVSGGSSLFRHVRRRLSIARRLGREPGFFSAPWTIPVAAFGLIGVGMVYFSILTPDNIAYDSRWYHLALAEHYAAEGAVRPFVEGWFQGALPHLASFLYCWAFQLPGLALFGRLETSAHIEFVVFSATLASIPVLVRWLVPGNSGRLAWVVLFLFPKILLYDSSLTVAADHIAAFWAIPTYLAFVRAWKRLKPSECALLAAMLSGAMLTKYQSMYLIFFPSAGIGLRAVWLALRPSNRVARGVWFRGPAVAVATGLVLTSPHWLKNLLFYGDPLYPFLHKHIQGHPWTPDTARLVEYAFKGTTLWEPVGTTSEKLLQTVKAIFTFSFIPNDWPTFHGTVPVFGSLFTLSLVVLPFLRDTRRLWAMMASTHVGLFVWFWTSHQDRYLQILLPWMVATVAGVIGLLWRSGTASKIATSCLIGLQAIWGGDVYFLPTHSMAGSAPKKVIDLLSSGYRKDYDDRFQHLGDYYTIGLSLPKHSKVLMHDQHMHLGLQAMSVSDWGAWQGGISYGRMRSPQEVYERLRGMGITHIVWQASSQHYDSLGGDLVFFDFVTRFARNKRQIGSMTLARMPVDAPEGPWNDTVAFLGCPGTYRAGIYPVQKLTVSPWGKHTPSEYPAPDAALDGDAVDALVEKASYVVIDPSCYPTAPPLKSRGFVLAATREKAELWVRKSNEGARR